MSDMPVEMRNELNSKLAESQRQEWVDLYTKLPNILAVDTLEWAMEHQETYGPMLPDGFSTQVEERFETVDEAVTRALFFCKKASSIGSIDIKEDCVVFELMRGSGALKERLILLKDKSGGFLLYCAWAC